MKGSYVLVLYLQASAELTIGRLGRFVFPPGYYLYVGSALGSGGLEARVARHRRQQKRLHWHIDYLLAEAELLEVWESATACRWECRWAQAALSLEGSDIPVPRFGASDCRCPAHLIHSAARPDPLAFASRLPGLAISVRSLEAR